MDFTLKFLKELSVYDKVPGNNGSGQVQAQGSLYRDDRLEDWRPFALNVELRAQLAHAILKFRKNDDVSFPERLKGGDIRKHVITVATATHHFGQLFPLTDRAMQQSRVLSLQTFRITVGLNDSRCI